MEYTQNAWKCIHFVSIFSQANEEQDLVHTTTPIGGMVIDHEVKPSMSHNGP